MAYCIYLRKSRADIELENSTKEDTLSRHREALFALAKKMNLPITYVYEEGVASGESISSRPEMQKLLNAVEQGVWEGVLCMEIERLARGDTIDQGIVSRTFRFSETKIITPIKIYDLANEFDEEYLEFSLFMSRREYKTINRRQQRGRIASVQEGKWCANKTPYGYDRQKLQGEKGFILVPNESEAPVVKQIFRWISSGEMKPPTVASTLNKMGIPARMGNGWTQITIRDMVANCAYKGYIRWQRRPVEVTVENGEIKKHRPRCSENIMIYKGRHEALVTEEEWETANRMIKYTHTKPGPKQKKQRNKFAGLLYCDQCGRAMILRPNPKNEEQIICPQAGCATKGAYISVVESAILDGLRSWLDEFNAETQGGEIETKEETTEKLLHQSINTLEKEKERLTTQLKRAYDLVEQGVYSTELFLERSRELSRNQKEVEEQIIAVKEQLATLQDRTASKRALIPQVIHVLDTYEKAENPEEKNNLLKSVIERISYHKTTGGRYGVSNLALTLYPRFINPNLTDNL